MITFLKGILDEKSPTRVVIDVHGVGYETLIPLSSYHQLPAQGHSVRLLTFHYVREDTQALFGFMSREERGMFEIMLGISGIGPKLALDILSGMSPRDIKTAVLEGNTQRLNAISGVGKKTAERLVIELRDKFSQGEALEALSGEAAAAPDAVRARDAFMALISLGYKQTEAHKMIKKITGKIAPETSIEDMVRMALTE